MAFDKMALLEGLFGLDLYSPLQWLTCRLL